LINGLAAFQIVFVLALIDVDEAVAKVLVGSKVVPKISPNKSIVFNDLLIIKPPLK
jgi:predicted CDP-diglyceride synthetase/phosphatidate cytidylyltransferase